MRALYYYLTIWAYAITKEVVARLLSIIFYPIAYIMQDRLRNHLYSIDKALAMDKTFFDANMVSVGDFYKRVNKLYFFLWLFLDDSTGYDSKHSDGSIMYCASDNDRHYPKWVLKTKWFWLRAMWWSFIRNNTVNFVSWFRTGGWTDDIEILAGDYEVYINKNDSNSYYKSGWYLVLVKHKNGKKYPYFTFIGKIFEHKIGIWQGFSRGSGRFSFSLRG
jgi:hypothetical protein